MDGPCLQPSKKKIDAYMATYKMITSVESSIVPNAVNSTEGRGSRKSCWKEAWRFQKGKMIGRMKGSI